MKIMLIMVFILTCMSIFQSCQILVYQYEFPRLVWSVKTLYLDFKAQRKMYIDCIKRN